MHDQIHMDSLAWYVVRTNPKQENRADLNLRSWDIETLAPKFKQYSYNQFTGKPTLLIKPLFPRYIFARFRPKDAFHKIRYTRGVHSVVSFGKGFTHVDDEIITLIRSRMQKDGFVRISEKFAPGDEVRIKEGALKDFIGIFEREMSEGDRVMILLNTISYQGHVVVDRKLLQKI